ncbi:hypothetical protein [Thalassotalea fusca]
MLRAVALLLLVVSKVVIAKDIVVYPWTGESNAKFEQHFVGLLDLALSKTNETFGAYEIRRLDFIFNQGRVIEFLKNNKKLSVAWTVTNIQREVDLLPIRVPLMKGLGGCRVGLIRKDEQVLFDEISSHALLKSVPIGQGHDWPDADILIANNYKVVLGHIHTGLFSMLAHKRFDLFLRSIFEAVHEETLYPDLEIEKRFVFYYPAPFYFFVSRENKRLANRLLEGFRIAQQDGSLSKFYDESELIQGAKKELSQSKREFILLNNPNISQETTEVMANEDYQLCREFTKAY